MKPEPEPVLDPQYWRERLTRCGGDLHRSIFEGSHDQFSVIEQKQRLRLLREVRPTDSILDAGCGYGRLLTLLPGHWHGDYLGIDISTDFIKIAKILYPDRLFIQESILDLSWSPSKRFDLGVVLWIKDMVLENVGAGTWELMQAQLERVCKRLLIFT